MDYMQQAGLWGQVLWHEVVPIVIEVLKGLAAPIIAFAALRVSRQQVRINESKLRLDMYDRRLNVYGAVKTLFTAFAVNGALSQNDLATFREQVVEVDFLFNDKVQAYVRELDEQARRLIRANYKYSRSPHKSAELAIEYLRQIDQLEDWFMEQTDVAKKVFKASVSPEPPH